jgi:hypothetical protein
MVTKSQRRREINLFIDAIKSVLRGKSIFQNYVLQVEAKRVASTTDRSPSRSSARLSTGPRTAQLKLPCR